LPESTSDPCQKHCCSTITEKATYVHNTNNQREKEVIFLFMVKEEKQKKGVL
jgi:hypothetical protein